MIGTAGCKFRCRYCFNVNEPALALPSLLELAGEARRAGADLSVECFARNLFNQGTMAVIHRLDKGADR